ncbi:MAG TPA: hypothetical protein VMI31_11100 [Fimbriimonadaceae bacterium]|nr:hypothetical protein [Fimbriimonadaceae bacterium]
MKLIASLAFLAASAMLFAQGPTFYRVRVRHADPWAIKALIEGTPIARPELSTILGFAGVPDKDSALIEEMFGGQGRLLVNPTDNSLIFIPDRKG